MKITALLVPCLVTTGCFAGVLQNVGHSDEEADQDMYKSWVEEPLAKANEITKDGLPQQLEDLEKAYVAWMHAHDAAENFQKHDLKGIASNHEYNLGNCDKGTRDKALCKKAAAGQAQATTKIAEIIEAAMQLDPDPARNFPAAAITEIQTAPDVMAAVHIKKALSTLADSWGAHWTKRLKKTNGNPSAVVRKEGSGICFFASNPMPSQVKPQVLFTGDTEDLYIRCVAPDALRGYDRTENDVVVVNLIGSRVDSEENIQTVKTFQVADIPAGDTFDIDLPMSLITKKLKKELNTDVYKSWKYWTLDVRYVVTKKVGAHTEEAGNGQVYVQDDDDFTVAAHGTALLDLDGASSDSSDTAASSDDADDEAPVAKKS